MLAVRSRGNKGLGVFDLCSTRELTGGSCGFGKISAHLTTCDMCTDVALAHVPESLRREEVRFPREKSLDKIFASRWLNQDTVCFGSKDNQLILWSYLTNYTRCIPLPRIPPPALGSPSVDSSESPDNISQCGIRDIDVSPDRSMLVCGADDPLHVAVFAVPSFSPAYVLQGHSDWVFAQRFIADDVIVTGARDGMLMCWKVPPISGVPKDVEFSSPVVEGGLKNRPNYSGPILEPTAVRMEHEQRLRCIECLPRSNEFCTLSGDGTVKFWDCGLLEVLRTIELDDTRDLVALGVSEMHNLVAVGSQTGTVLYDPRDSRFEASIPTDNTCGVRSLSFNKDVLTIGGGSGTVGFYDVRCGSFRKYGKQQHLKCSSGFLRPADEVVEAIGHEPPQAVYTVQYDPFNTKIFVGGGPLMCGISGCYGAVWG